MASAGDDDDLKPTETEGYKIGQKKTVDEYTNLDAEDEALNRWKASLGIGVQGESIADPSDPRRVVVLDLALEVSGRPDVVIDLTQPGALESLSSRSFTIKEGAEYRMRVSFRVQHELITGLRYLQLVKRRGIKVDKAEHMLGSFAPNTKTNPSYEKKFDPEQAPSGMIARGNYNVVSKFMDDDHIRDPEQKPLLEFRWKFEIKRDWD